MSNFPPFLGVTIRNFLCVTVNHPRPLPRIITSVRSVYMRKHSPFTSLGLNRLNSRVGSRVPSSGRPSGHSSYRVLVGVLPRNRNEIRLRDVFYWVWIVNRRLKVEVEYSLNKKIFSPSLLRGTGGKVYDHPVTLTVDMSPGYNNNPLVPSSLSRLSCERNRSGDMKSREN